MAHAKPREMWYLRIVRGKGERWPEGCLFWKCRTRNGLEDEVGAFQKTGKKTVVSPESPAKTRREPKKTAEREQIRGDRKRSYENEPRNSARSEPSKQRCWRV